MTGQLMAATLRRWAAACDARADNPKTSWSERARLLKIRKAMLDLAKTRNKRERPEPEAGYRRAS